MHFLLLYPTELIRWKESRFATRNYKRVSAFLAPDYLFKFIYADRCVSLHFTEPNFASYHEAIFN